LSAVKESQRGLYEAAISLSYGGRSYQLRIERLARRPVTVRTSVKGEHVVLELYDSEARIIATCCIHRGQLEKGCMDCQSLLLPPREEQACRRG
jgi:hypothetical protein